MKTDDGESLISVIHPKKTGYRNTVNESEEKKYISNNITRAKENSLRTKK